MHSSAMFIKHRPVPGTGQHNHGRTTVSKMGQLPALQQQLVAERGELGSGYHVEDVAHKERVTAAVFELGHSWAFRDCFRGPRGSGPCPP